MHHLNHFAEVQLLYLYPMHHLIIQTLLNVWGWKKRFICQIALIFSKDVWQALSHSAHIFPKQICPRSYYYRKSLAEFSVASCCSQNLIHSFLFLGLGKFAMLSTFACTGLASRCPTTWHKYTTVTWPNSYFARLTDKFALESLWNNALPTCQHKLPHPSPIIIR